MQNKKRFVCLGKAFFVHFCILYQIILSNIQPTEMLLGFLLGITGSLHCIGMCGAMVVAMQKWSLPARFWWGQARYHVGKVLGYTLMGALVGLVGKSLTLVFSQQGVSITIGAMLLLSLTLPAYLLRQKKNNTWLTKRLQAAFQNRSSQFVIGFLNAFLPCGVVYVALASALATGEWYDAMAFMAMFGIGTMPALLGVAWAGKLLQKVKQSYLIKGFRLQYTLTFTLGALLILRGMNLGIPYISPAIAPQTNEIECCKVK